MNHEKMLGKPLKHVFSKRNTTKWIFEQFFDFRFTSKVQNEIFTSIAPL